MANYTYVFPSNPDLAVDLVDSPVPEVGFYLIRSLVRVNYGLHGEFLRDIGRLDVGVAWVTDDFGRNVVNSRSIYGMNNYCESITYIGSTDFRPFLRFWRSDYARTYEWYVQISSVKLPW